MLRIDWRYCRVEDPRYELLWKDTTLLHGQVRKLISFGILKKRRKVVVESLAVWNNFKYEHCFVFLIRCTYDYEGSQQMVNETRKLFSACLGSMVAAQAFGVSLAGILPSGIGGW